MRDCIANPGIERADISKRLEPVVKDHVDGTDHLKPALEKSARVQHTQLLMSVCCILGFAGCTSSFDTPVTTGGTVSLKTYGNMGTATSRARLACGEPMKTPVLMSLSGTGQEQMATFGCL